MTLEEVMSELESLGKERMKKLYIARGAREPLYGVATGAMKPLFRRIKKDQALAERLYATGNYDAMVFAGMIADPKAMGDADFDRWIKSAYFPMLSDYVVAVTLAEADCAQSVADRWIDSGEELTMSAGWACYEWLLGWRPDREFDRDKLRSMLDRVARSIHDQPDRTRYAMNNFVIAVGVSYLPLHDEAIKTAVAMGDVKLQTRGGECERSSAAEAIHKAEEMGRLGFKRKAVRC
jgi:3-methyladenine DNA glycosylase AlkD